MIRWAIKIEERSKLDGRREYIVGGGTLTFKTRAECRLYIEGRYGYIKYRRDLRRDPHYWRMPKAVKVRLELIEVSDERRTRYP